MKKIIIICLLTLGVSYVFACDMMAMIAKDGETISAITSIANEFNDPIDYFDFIQARSTNSTSNYGYVSSGKPNDDGYGFSYYPADGSFHYNQPNYDDQAWYKTSQDEQLVWHYPSWPYSGWTWYGDPNHTWLLDEPLDIAKETIMNINSTGCEACIVFGHDRQGTGGYGNHPFRFEYDNKTYTFMQNGSLPTNIITALETYLAALETGEWFTNHSPNWIEYSTTGNHFIDSELLFHYIMSFIMECGDVAYGIERALVQTDIENENILHAVLNPEEAEDKITKEKYYTNVFNFILSDGEDIYVFRNSYDDQAEEPNTWDKKHELSYIEHNDFYAIKTVEPTVAGTLIKQFDLMKFSRDEDPEIIFDLDFEIKEFEEDGYNWVSFPLLERDETTNATEDIVPYLDRLYPFSDIDYIELIFEDDIELDYYPIPQWDPGDYDVHSTLAYKIDIDSDDDDFILPMTGSRMEPDYIIEDDFDAYTDYWIGYWLPETQNIADALDDLWGYVETVSAQDWYYDKCSNYRGIGEATPVSWSTTGKNMEYGKGFIITFNDDFSDFYWTQASSRTITEGYDIIESSNFSFNELPSYEVIDVIDIPANVTEIGVFQDETCVGAVTVPEPNIQILVYTQAVARDEIPLSLKVITGRSLVSPVINYNVFNENTDLFEPGSIVAGHQKSSIIMLGNIGEPEENETPSIDDLKLHGNYPNPFNPTTNISFSLPADQDIELVVYNMKGQLVRKLVQGQFTSGVHSVTWDGKDDNSKNVGSGLYFYKLITTDQEISKKMLLLK
jgi:FlgD Ig-like domain